jgi:hypothetical protein
MRIPGGSDSGFTEKTIHTRELNRAETKTIRVEKALTCRSFAVTAVWRYDTAIQTWTEKNVTTGQRGRRGTQKNKAR